jgi:hypothetical protein
MNLVDKLKSAEGRFLISVLLGLGLAAAFRSTCTDGRCVVVKAPQGIQGSTYHIDDDCYRYEKYPTRCTTP